MANDRHLAKVERELRNQAAAVAAAAAAQPAAGAALPAAAAPVPAAAHPGPDAASRDSSSSPAGPARTLPQTPCQDGSCGCTTAQKETQEGFRGVRADMGALRADMGALRADMGALRADMGAFEARLKEFIPGAMERAIADAFARAPPPVAPPHHSRASRACVVADGIVMAYDEDHRVDTPAARSSAGSHAPSQVQSTAASSTSSGSSGSGSSGSGSSGSGASGSGS
jgi:hypothetical protein